MKKFTVGSSHTNKQNANNLDNKSYDELVASDDDERSHFSMNGFNKLKQKFL